MSVETAICWIGLSHLLQPPLALMLTKRLALSSALSASSPLLASVMRNMVFASIALPTASGILLARHAHETANPGLARSLAWTLSAFWCWRLTRQCLATAEWRRSGAGGALLHGVLTLIFLLQGPGLALLLALDAAGR